MRRIVLGISFLLLTSPSRTQDYPYDDEPAPAEPGTAHIAPPTTESASRLPVEAPGARPAVRRGRQPALFRLGIKAGANFSFLSSRVAGSHTGLGLEGALSAGWDLPYQPIFLELESGYRSHFMGDDPVHILPLRFGVFNRIRLGRAELWKPGIAVSLDTRFESSGSGTEISLLPALHLTSQFEFGSFLAEPTLMIYRLVGAVNSASFAFRGGYRF